jgi:hypothetical protein
VTAQHEVLGTTSNKSECRRHDTRPGAVPPGLGCASPQPRTSSWAVTYRASGTLGPLFVLRPLASREPGDRNLFTASNLPGSSEFTANSLLFTVPEYKIAEFGHKLAILSWKTENSLFFSLLSGT